MAEFEIFKERYTPVTNPTIAVTMGGLLTLNGAAYDALGEPELVELLYDRKARIIGMRKTEPIDHAYLVRKNGESRSFQVAATAFLAHYAIDHSDVTRRYKATLRDGILQIDLKSEPQEIRSARRKAPSR